MKKSQPYIFQTSYNIFKYILYARIFGSGVRTPPPHSPGKLISWMNFHSKIAENMPSGSAHISLIQSKAARLYDVETTFCRRWKCDFVSYFSGFELLFKYFQMSVKWWPHLLLKHFTLKTPNSHYTRVYCRYGNLA